MLFGVRGILLLIVLVSLPNKKLADIPNNNNNTVVIIISNINNNNNNNNNKSDNTSDINNTNNCSGIATTRTKTSPVLPYPCAALPAMDSPVL